MIKEIYKVFLKLTFPIASVKRPVILLHIFEDKGDDAAGNSLITVFSPSKQRK